MEGSFRRRTPQMAHEFATALLKREYSARMNIVASRAGLIPVGGPVSPIAGDRVLLVDDAAGWFRL